MERKVVYSQEDHLRGEKIVHLRLVFTSDEVRVLIRSIGQYNLLKIKPKQNPNSAYDPVKTRLSELQALFWYQTVIGASASDSNNIVFTGS